MLTLHHLDYSRSTRVLWLLEELGVPFELLRYRRTERHRAPEALKAFHPLGKSPILVDDDLTLAESSAILRYLEARYGDGRFVPPPGTNARAIHDEWLDYVEGSAALPIMMTILGAMLGGLSDGLSGFVGPELHKSLRYISDGIGKGPFLMGKQLTLADMQISYMLDVAERIGALGEFPVVAAYLDRLKEQPGMVKAVARGGPMASPRR